MRLKLCAFVVLPNVADGINPYETCIVADNHITAFHEADAGGRHVRLFALANHVCPLKKSVFLYCPKCEACLSVCDQQVVVQRVKGTTGQPFLVTSNLG